MPRLEHDRPDDLRSRRSRRTGDGVVALEHGWFRRTVQALADHHVYFGLLRRDGSYQELFAGPNRERLLGGTPAVGQDPSALWRSRIHSDDFEAFRACDERLRAGVASQVDYRVHGLDGVTRWIRVSSSRRS